MSEQEKVAYLQELAQSHYADGNLDAALAAWRQVLEVDASNEDARRGIALVEQKTGGTAAAGASAGGGGPFDPDSTMVFDPNAGGGGGGGGGQAAGGFDPDSTMVFDPRSSGGGGGQAAQEDTGFDADSTMMWNAGDSGDDAGGSAPEEDDADSTMMWDAGDSSASESQPEPPPPPPPPPQDDDGTMLSAPAVEEGGSDLEDFDLPSGDLAMAGAPDPGQAPPDLGDVGLPEDSLAGGAPGGAADEDASGGSSEDGGFSFELPPPPPAGGGDGPGIPDLPNLGPPPAPPPPPTAEAPPPPPPGPSSDFQEASDEEVDSLAVPTVGFGSAGRGASSGSEGEAGADADELPPMTPEEQAEREARLAQEYAQMYGRDTGGAQPLPLPGAGVAPAKQRNWKLIGGVALVLVIFLGGIWGVVSFLQSQVGQPDLPDIPTDDPNVEPVKSEAEWRADYEGLLKEVEQLLQEGSLDDATLKLQEARGIAIEKLGQEPDDKAETLQTGIDAERQYQAKFQQAVVNFCNEDWGPARLSFLDLAALKPDDPRPGEYIERIYYNAGVNYLQQKVPWEAVWYFSQVLERDPDDAEAQVRKEFAESFGPGDSLGYEYTRVVDNLPYRTAGCQ